MAHTSANLGPRSSFQTVQSMKENGAARSEMATANKCGTTVPNTWVIGKKAKPAARASSHTSTVMFTMESGSMTRPMASASTHTATAVTNTVKSSSLWPRA